MSCRSSLCAKIKLSFEFMPGSLTSCLSLGSWKASSLLRFQSCPYFVTGLFEVKWHILHIDRPLCISMSMDVQHSLLLLVV